ncbi:uncharacterized protein LOC108922784 [Scleropages formosus]|uniref:uncharacterized protein LOC108922784 n=1 Tax=Scleropages formosus TaxID=113540 RepID=UPI0010FACCEC|nr:uncharacterized protein LOC108922784 [Scleropages formosus]
MVRSDSPRSKGDVSIADDPDQLVFTVTMRNLQEKDAGWYWCGVEINGAVDDYEYLSLTVTTGVQSVWTVSRISAERGGLVTIPCYYDQKYKQHVKYWCKGYTWSSCTTMVHSDSPQSKGEVSITDDTDQLVFSVTMRNLQMKDTDWYWCGVKDGRDRVGAPLYLNISDNNLVLINMNMTWNEALNYCRTHHVDLVSTHTKEIQLWVQDRVKKASTAHVWIGLRVTCVLNFWFWVSAETFFYHNWAPGNGTGAEKCGATAAVESGGRNQWVSFPETEKLNFICCG